MVPSVTTSSPDFLNEAATFFASFAATTTIMPMPQLKVRSISRSATLPTCCSHWNTGV